MTVRDQVNFAAETSPRNGQGLDSLRCFFTCTGSIFGCSDIGAVQAPQVEIDEPFFIELELQRFQNGINPACILPTPEGVVDRIPWSETFWKVSSRNSGVEYPENAIEHLARFTGRAPDQASRRKLGLDKPPLCISQLITAGHGMDLKLLRRCEIISSSL